MIKEKKRKLKQGEVKKITKTYEGDEKDFKGSGIEGTKGEKRYKRKKKRGETKMLTKSEEIIVAQLSKIRRDFKVFTAKWDTIVAAVMATPLFKNLKKLEG